LLLRRRRLLLGKGARSRWRLLRIGSGRRRSTQLRSPLVAKEVHDSATGGAGRRMRPIGDKLLLLLGRRRHCSKKMLLPLSRDSRRRQSVVRRRLRMSGTQGEMRSAMVRQSIWNAGHGWNLTNGRWTALTNRRSADNLLIGRRTHSRRRWLEPHQLRRPDEAGTHQRRRMRRLNMTDGYGRMRKRLRVTGIKQRGAGGYGIAAVERGRAGKGGWRSLMHDER
jgi:hypothetical protein